MRLIPIVLVLAAGLGLAACGGGEPSTTEQPPTTAGPAEPPAISYDSDPGSVVVDVTPLPGFVPAELAVDADVDIAALRAFSDAVDALVLARG